MKYILRTIGCLVLVFFPVILLIDLVFGFMLTGVKATFAQSFSGVWAAWVETFWSTEQ